MLRIIHLDDQVLFSSGVRAVILKKYPDAFIESFPSNDTALKRLNRYLVSKEKPDLIITDYNHLNGNGLEFARQAKSLCFQYRQRVPIIMLTMRGKDLIIPNGLKGSPLDGFLQKSCSAEDILNLIHQVLHSSRSPWQKLWSFLGF